MKIFLLIVFLNPLGASVVPAETQAQCLEAAAQFNAENRNAGIDNLVGLCVESADIDRESLTNLLKNRVE